MARVELALSATPDPLNAVSSSGGGAGRDGERTEFIQLECGSPLVVRSKLKPKSPVVNSVMRSRLVSISDHDRLLPKRDVNSAITCFPFDLPLLRFFYVAISTGKLPITVTAVLSQAS